MKENTLVVSETFYSIQGEGQTTGVPSVFLRLGGCNLFCEGKGWRCDTIEVWTKGRNTPFDAVLTPVLVYHLRAGAHLVITGGEPLLQQSLIVDYLNWFRQEHKFTPAIEIETNGTIVPSDVMITKVDYWNCSPKLSTTGEPYEKRMNEVAIAKIQREGRSPSFKFVISLDSDVLEVGADWGLIKRENTIFMPAGDTRHKLEAVRPWLIEACKSLGVKYCDRLHIIIWNKKTGV